MRVMGYRVLAYLDDFLVGSSLTHAATRKDCLRASRLLGIAFDRYGLTRHPTKGVWGKDSMPVEHLGFTVDTVHESFDVPVRKVIRVADKAKHLLKLASRNRRMVSGSGGGVRRNGLVAFVDSPRSRFLPAKTTGLSFNPPRFWRVQGSSFPPRFTAPEDPVRLSHWLSRASYTGRTS
jgi:hypothetical protein